MCLKVWILQASNQRSVVSEENWLLPTKFFVEVSTALMKGVQLPPEGCPALLAGLEVTGHETEWEPILSVMLLHDASDGHLGGVRRQGYRLVGVRVSQDTCIC